MEKHSTSKSEGICIDAQRHPELQEGEIFLSNVTKKEGVSSYRYRTARMGNIAYDSKGDPIEGMFPVFVNKEELDEV